MTDHQPPKTITPEAREAIQGIYAGAQNEGVRIAGLAEVQSIEDTLVGSVDNPTNLGPTVEISVPIDASGKPIPQIEDRTEFQPASAVLTIRVVPQRDLGGEFFTAQTQVVDVETGRIIYSRRSGATSDERAQLEAGRPESEYGNDPAFTAGLLALESTTVEEAVAVAIRGAVGGAGIALDQPDTSPAVALPSDAGPSEAGPSKAGPMLDAIPGGVLTLLGAAGAVLVIAAFLIFSGGGGDGDTTGDGDPSANSGANDSTGGTSSGGNDSSGGNNGSGGGNNGGGSSSSTSGPRSFVAADATGDLKATWDDFDPIESPNIAADVTELLVEVDESANQTRITLRFAGAAQGLQDIAGEALAGDVLIRPPGDELIHNILLRDDGTAKLSEPPAGMSLATSWAAPDTVVFTVSGYVPPDGSTVWVSTIQEYRGTFSSDEVEVEITG